MKLKLRLSIAGVVVIVLLIWVLAVSNKDLKIASTPPTIAGHPLSATSAAFFSSDSLGKSNSGQRSGALPSTAPWIPSSAQGASTAKGLKGLTVAGGNGVTFAGASFRVDAQDYHLQPDRFGAYPRIPVSAGEKIPVTVQFDQGDAGDAVSVRVEDGGGMNDLKHATQTETLDSQLNAQFNFVAGTQVGIYRVAVTYRGQIQTLQFWVGELPQLRSVARGQ